MRKRAVNEVQRTDLNQYAIGIKHDFLTKELNKNNHFPIHINNS